MNAQRWAHIRSASVPGLFVAGLFLLMMTVGPNGEAPKQALAPAGAAPVAESCRAFGADVYAQLASQEGNVLFSPLSAWAALAMAYAGARGGTAEAMAGALHISPGATGTHEQFGELLSELRAAGAAKGCELRIANAAWFQREWPVQPGFLRVVTGPYGAAVEQADFAQDPAGAAAEVNRWVSRETNGKISRVLEPGDLHAQTRFVLANAVYFKAQWASRFPSGKTRKEPFFLGGGQTQTVPLMHQTGEFLYAESEGTQALPMPYRGNALAMLVVLPPALGHGRGGELPEQGAPDVGEWLGKLQPYEVEVSLPKFTFSTCSDLRPLLVPLGMGEAFEPGRADFSGIGGLRDLFLDRAVQGAFIEVDEEGTTAAAATAVAGGCGVAVPPPKAVFRADRPFTFAIVHGGSGLPLFVGRMSDPTPH